MISRVDEEGEQSYAYDRRGNLTAVSRGEEQLKAFTFDVATGQKPQNPEQQIYYTLDLTRQYHNYLPGPLPA